tara:strand:+ start:308 stop:466 length:159 start_codon:yes stop_codon:yes gene_type:complete
MNLSTKKQNITINKSANNLAENSKSMPLTNKSFKNFLGRIQGVSKSCSACGK